MAKTHPYSFFVVLADGIMEIQQSSNLSWLTLFYVLPKELVAKRPEYLEFPRNIYLLLQSEEHKKLIKSDTFLELVWDCYAWAAWQYFQVPGKDGTYRDIPGDWSHYSGDFPLWRLSYEIQKHFRHKFEIEMEWSIQMDEFKGKLSEVDRQMLQMRYDGHSLKEIAADVGFKTPSVVSKHIEKIAERYEDFVSDEYSDFLDKHTK